MFRFEFFFTHCAISGPLKFLSLMILIYILEPFHLKKVSYHKVPKLHSILRLEISIAGSIVSVIAGVSFDVQGTNLTHLVMPQTATRT